MKNILSTSLIILAVLLIGGGGWVYSQPSSINLSITGSQTCLQSAVQPYAFASVCPAASTYIDNFLYVTSQSSSTGLWCGSGCTTGDLGGFLKAYYFLQLGTSLQSYNMTYNIGYGFQPLQSITGVDSATGLQWVGASVPNAALPSGYPTDFRLTIRDSYGTQVTKDGSVTYNAAAANYVILFSTVDGTNSISLGQTPPLPGVQIIVTSSASGSVVGQAVTGSTGQATIAIPNNGGTYFAQPTPPATYYAQNGVVISSTAPISFTFYHGPACTTTGQSNCYPPCAAGENTAIAGQVSCTTATSQTTTTHVSVTGTVACTTISAGASTTTTCSTNSCSAAFCTPTTISGVTTSVTLPSGTVTACYTSVLTTTETIAGQKVLHVGTSCTTFVGGGGAGGQSYPNQTTGAIMILAGVGSLFLGLIARGKPTARA